VKKRVSSRKHSKKRGNMKVKNIVNVIAILIIAFIVITSIIPEKKQADYNLNQQQRTYSSCEERCTNNDECLKDCYTATINQAVLKSDTKLCETIKVQEQEQSCLDKIYLKEAIIAKDLSKCDLIQSSSLKQTCMENAK